MNKVKDKVVFIVLDAFRHDYINAVDTPFLYSKISAGIYAEKLKSVAGFAQRTALYTGTTGSESGMFTMYTFDSEKSPFRFLKSDPLFKKLSVKKHWWDKLLALRGLGRMRKIIRSRFERQKEAYIHWVKQEAKKYADHAPIAHIPFELLPEIGVSEDNLPIYLPGAFEQESIFDVFAQNNIKYEYLMYPVVDGDDSDTLEAFLNKKDSDARIILGFFSASDKEIHLYGPSSSKRSVITGEIDRKLREIVSYYDDDLSTWVVIGDHGMTDVIEEINVPELILPMERKLKVKLGRDYLLFLDSTMARFRWITENGKEFLDQIMQLPMLLEKGRFVDDQIAHEYSIPLHDRRYGDLIWWANSGFLLFPDYFHDHNVHNKGMHGYDSNHDDMKGFFIAFGAGVESGRLNQVNLIDVCPTICDLVEVPYPKHNKGISVFSQLKHG